MRATVAVLVGLLLLALPAVAAAEPVLYNRTFISATGSDSGECQRLTPCATWGGAYDHTLAGGTITALDSGEFGSVLIQKSVTLDGAVFRPKTVTFTVPVTVNSSTAKVVIKGLVLDGEEEISPGFSAFAIDIQAARAVRIEGVRISDFGRAAIRFATSNPSSRLSITDSEIVNNGGYGVAASAPTSGATGALNRVTLRNVIVSENGLGGVSAEATGATGVVVSVFDSLISSNATEGIRANGARAKQRISNNDVFANGQGLKVLNGGNILSWGNNRVVDNGIDGAPTVMASQK